MSTPSARADSVGLLLDRIRRGEAIALEDMSVLETRAYRGLSGVELAAVVNEIRLQNPGLENVLALMGNEPVAEAFIRFAARRIEAADGAMTCVSEGSPFPSPLKFAFGLLTSHHEAFFAEAVAEGRLTREALVACAFDGPELSRRLGEMRVSLPIRFETIEGDLGAVYRGAEAPKSGDAWGFDVPHVIDTKHGRFLLRCSNAIELWRAGTLTTKEPETVAWLDETIHPESVLYDVGANVGIYSLYAAHMFSGVRVVSFEPDPLNFARLNKNIHTNGFSGRVVPYPVACSSRGGVSELNSSAFVEGKAEHIVGLADASPGARAFDHKAGLIVVTLDTFVESAPALPSPTHLKIDVDGMDMEVLKGASRMLRRESLTDVIVEGFHEASDTIRSLLEPHGFRHVRTTDHRRLPVSKPYGNYLFSRHPA